MQALFREIKKMYPRMNKISRRYIKYGSFIILTLYFLALFCNTAKGNIGNYDYLLFMRNEFLVAGGEMMSAIYVPALIIEIVRCAYLVQFGSDKTL